MHLAQNLTQSRPSIKVNYCYYYHSFILCLELTYIFVAVTMVKGDRKQKVVQ